jgi:hypothetical protein
MGSLSENTQNTHPTKGASLNIQAEISKKRTNFGMLVTAIAAARMCINRKSPARKSGLSRTAQELHKTVAQ